MLIKVCGMREPDNIHAVEQLDVDMIGFIFWPDSPRYVSSIRSRAGIIPDYTSFKEELPGKAPACNSTPAARVGVFVDDMPQNIVTRVYNYGLQYVQLHGHESPVMIDNLRRTLDPDIRFGIRIIKALSIASAEDLKRCQEYEGHVDMFLFDTKCACVGGSGEQFDWSVLSHYDGHTPFLLSGGIGPDDAARVKAFSYPRFAGIDLNSRFETLPAVKDVEALRKFIAEIRN
ncbi:MAG: phosphoribosylanthranilate isomerase [Prevotella sp.]|nr:phosphoribosylanthranilate isomerase [Prevotella sp.]